MKNFYLKFTNSRGTELTERFIYDGRGDQAAFSFAEWKYRIILEWAADGYAFTGESDVEAFRVERDRLAAAV